MNRGRLISGGFCRKPAVFIRITRTKIRPAVLLILRSFVNIKRVHDSSAVAKRFTRFGSSRRPHRRIPATAVIADVDWAGRPRPVAQSLCRNRRCSRRLDRWLLDRHNDNRSTNTWCVPEITTRIYWFLLFKVRNVMARIIIIIITTQNMCMKTILQRTNNGNIIK